MTGSNQPPSVTNAVREEDRPFVSLHSRGLLFLAAALLLAGGLLGIPPLAAQDGNTGQSQELSRQAAQSAAAKFRIVREAHDSGAAFSPVRITELEANSYLHYEYSPDLPAGSSQARLAFQPGRVSGSSLVDFDKLKEGLRTPPHPIADFLLRGEHTIAVQGTASGANGIGEFRLERVMLDGVPLPQPVVEFLIEHYLRPRYPNAAIDRPFRLPFSIDSFRAETGSVVLTGKR
jgi:hypothetical protein